MKEKESLQNGLHDGDVVRNASEQVETLLVRLRAGEDPGAFEGLCVLYNNLLTAMVRRFAPSLGIRDGVASEVLGIGQEELRQEATIALYRAALSYVPEETGKGGDVSFGLYAKICIRNAMISQVRRYRRRLKQAEALSQKAETEEARKRDGVEMDALAGETLRQMQAELSPYENRILPLYMEGKPPRRIAKELGRTEKSVSNGIYRIKAKLRQLLERT